MPSHNMVIAVMFSREEKKSRDWAVAPSPKSVHSWEPPHKEQVIKPEPTSVLCHTEVKGKSFWRNWKYYPRLHYFEMIPRSMMCIRRQWAVAYWRWGKKAARPHLRGLQGSGNHRLSSSPSSRGLRLPGFRFSTQPLSAHRSPPACPLSLRVPSDAIKISNTGMTTSEP